jgi:stage II sporulation protein R
MTMTRLIKAIAVAVALSLILSLCGFAGECGQIRERVLRLHVLANSDSEEDQQLKLKVRDTIVETAKGLFDNARDEGDALETAREQLPALIAAAQQRVYDEGYDYTVDATLCNMYFTTRYYDKVGGGESVTLPAGLYDALRVTIGEGKGKNWWCVVFPPLCVSAAEQPASSDGEAKAEDPASLDDVLDQNQKEIVTQPEKYEIRFKAVELFEGLCRQIGSWFGQPESTPLD